MNELIYDLHQAESAFFELVDRAASGEEIIIAKAGNPLAKLVPLTHDAQRRRPGGWEGAVEISEDFEAPLPADLLDAFEGEK